MLSHYSSLRLRWGMAAVLACLCASSHSQTYPFVNWSVSLNTGYASLGSLGPVTVAVTSYSSQSTTSPSLPTVNPWAIQFNSVPFTPTLANGLGIQNTGIQTWGFTINLSGVSDTNGVIVGLGNFGHGSAAYPGYRLAAYDLSNNLLPSLAGFTVLGSYDHSWTVTSDQFNDDLSLNMLTGDFTSTVIPGLNDQNSDMMLLQLPTGISRLDVFTPRESYGDTVNVVLAARDPVPEPFTMTLLAAGVIAAIRKRRSRQSS